MNIKDFNNIKNINDNKYYDDELKNKYDEYIKMDSNQLYNEYLSEFRKAKLSGKIDNEKINDILKKLSPFLDEETKKKLLKFLNVE